VLDEPRLAAAGRSLEHHRESTLVAFGEDVDLVAGGQVVRLAGEAADSLFDGEIGDIVGRGRVFDVAGLQSQVSGAGDGCIQYNAKPARGSASVSYRPRTFGRERSSS
jgi:hypothetical protein